MFNLSFTKKDLVRVFWAAAFAFLATFLPLATGLGKFHNFNEVKAAVLALIPTALAAAFSAVKNLVLADGSTLKG